MKSFFVWLGSKRAEKKGVGTKGALLDQATKANLPVPNGAILLDELFEAWLHDGVLVLDNGRITCPDPAQLSDSLFNIVRLPQFDQEIAIRSAFSAEERPNAEQFTSCLNVDSHNPTALANALCLVWGSALKQSGEFRKDVLLMEMVEAQMAGGALSEPAYQDDVINFTEGLADTLVTGQVAGSSLMVPQLQWGEAVTKELPEFAQRVQQLLRGVRRTFGASQWSIEWADDGQICWLIQLHPITRSTRRNEAYLFANSRVQLPDPLSPFMAHIMTQSSKRVFDYFRQFDSQLPTNRPMLQVFKERPFFNISLLTDMLRKWGLQTTLITNDLGVSNLTPTNLNWLRIIRHIPILFKLGWAQLTAVAHAKKATSQLIPQDSLPEQNFSELTDTFIHTFTCFVTEMLNLTQSVNSALFILRTTKTLTEHNGRYPMITTQSLTDLAPLQTAVQQNQSWQTALKNGKMPEDKVFHQLWRVYLNRHGHRGIYETDISRPRYHEDPSPLFTLLTTPPVPIVKPSSLSWKGLLTTPIWWHYSRVMQMREQWHDDTMRTFDQIRQQYLKLAQQAVSKGQLPKVDTLWLLTPNEVRLLENGKQFTQTEVEKRKVHHEEKKAYDFPNFIYAFDDLDTYLTRGEKSTQAGALIKKA